MDISKGYLPIGDQYWEQIWQDAPANHVPGQDPRKLNTIQHLPWLFILTLGLDAQRVLDIGLCFGNTAYTFCRACELTGGTVESVELYPHQPTVEKLKADFGVRWRLHIGRSEEILPTLEPGYDLICIDGGHDFEVVQADWENSRRLIRKGGIIAMHDTVDFRDVRQVYEWAAQDPFFVPCGVVNCCGMGLLWRKE